MSNHDDERIKISLEISIPAGRVPEVSQLEIHPRGNSSGRQSADGVQVPMLGADWKVKMLGSGPGVICARGDGYDDADRVKGHCYPSPSNDPDPPSGADEAMISSNFWELKSVRGARAGTNTLRVWYLNGSSVIHTENRTFNGIASSHTECEGTITSFASTPSRVFLPSQWSVQSCAFSSEVAFFNKQWTLHMRPEAGQDQQVVWRSTAAPSGPVVELVAQLQDESATLTFRCGASEIVYRKSAGEWNAVSICEFTDVTSRGVPPSTTIPAVVQLHPGTSQ